MPNGKYSPQCYNCTFFRGSFLPNRRWSNNRRRCKKHDFVLPYISAELICSDWFEKNWLQRLSLQKSKASDHFTNLESGFLYNYFHWDYNSPIKFGAFSELQNLFIEARVHNDGELGWVIYLRKEWYSFFPEPSKSIEIQANGENILFQALDIERSLYAGSKRLPSGEWEHRYANRIQRLLYCPSAPHQLYEWINASIDADKYLAEEKAKEHKMSPFFIYGFSVLLEVIEKNKTYRLQSNLLSYKGYQRN